MSEDSKKNTLREFGDSISALICCALFHILTPLLPLIIDYFLNHRIIKENLFITVVGYSIALAISSKWLWFFCVGVFISLVYSLFYGLSGSNSNIDNDNYTIYVILALIGCHAIERFYRHLMLKAPFFEFKI